MHFGSRGVVSYLCLSVAFYPGCTVHFGQQIDLAVHLLAFKGSLALRDDGVADLKYQFFLDDFFLTVERVTRDSF